MFIAGGTGIAPLRAMLRHALAIPHSGIGLLYSARTADEFAYQEEFRALARDGRLELKQMVTRAAGEDWTGGRGRIGPAVLEPLVHDPATLCFICGPAAMVDEKADNLKSEVRSRKLEVGSRKSEATESLAARTSRPSHRVPAAPARWRAPLQPETSRSPRSSRHR